MINEKDILCIGAGSTASSGIGVTLSNDDGNYLIPAGKGEGTPFFSKKGSVPIKHGAGYAVVDMFDSGKDE